VTLRTSDAHRRATRLSLLVRDGPGCRAQQCVHPHGRYALDPGTPWSIGHIRPVSLGGGDGLANLRLEHLACNVRAGATYPRATVMEP
jgi:hypothetical protein